MQMLGDIAVIRLQLESITYKEYLNPKLRQKNERMLTIISSVLGTVRYLYNVKRRFNKRFGMKNSEFTLLLLVDWLRNAESSLQNLVGS